jgi:hypothetical protein
VLDGEIVCLDRHGKTQFKDLLFRRGEPRFYACNLLRLDWCFCDTHSMVSRKYSMLGRIHAHRFFGDALDDPLSALGTQCPKRHHLPIVLNDFSMECDQIGRDYHNPLIDYVIFACSTPELFDKGNSQYLWVELFSNRVLAKTPLPKFQINEWTVNIPHF